MKGHVVLFFVVVLAACLTQFAADIYAPSLPSITVSLKTTVELAQWSLAVYMLGVAISQVIYGPISEGIGRKPPLIIGIVIMLVGSILCMLASDIDTLITGRFIQGLGAGACASLWRSVFRDVFSGEELSRLGSYLVVFIMFIVPAAPALGGYLQHFFSWRANFTFMVGYNVIALLAILFFFKETNKHHHLKRLKPSFIFKTFKQLLTSRVFMGVSLCTFLTYGAFFAWFTTGPILLIQIVGISPVSFGWISFLGGGAAYALAGWSNGKVVKRFGMANMMRFGWSVMIVAGLMMLIAKFIFGINTLVIVIPVLLVYFGSTFIWPNAVAYCFTPFGKIAGYAGALYGSLQIAGGAALGGLMAKLPDKNQIPLSLVILISAALSWIIFEKFVPKKVVSDTEV